LTVEDHGVGIPEDMRARIFDPFFTTKPRDKGTGLGLSIVKRAVEGHGGSIVLTSTPGVETTFTMKIPMPCECN
jgi:signal transduction histidine kinase